MFHHSSPPPRKRWIASLAALASLCGSAFAQNLSMQVADSNPLGIGNFIPSSQDLDMGLTGAVKGAFAYGFEAETAYNSNFFLTTDDEDDELSLFFSPWIRYISDPEGGANLSFTANYQPVMRSYLDNSDLNGMDQAGDFSVRLQGVKTDISVFGRYEGMSGTDRLTGEFVEGAVMTGGIRANRQIASRTSLNAGWSAAKSSFDSSDSEGAEVYTTYIGGMWDASQRISVGSTVRYTISESDNTGTRDAWALLMEARYRAGEKIWLSASLGPEYAVTSGAGNDDSSLGLTGEIAARYDINDRWMWTTSVRNATIPSPSETNYLVNDILFTTTLQHQLTRGSVSGGLEYRFSDYEDVGTVTTTRGDENNLSAFVAYHRNFFQDRLAFDTTLRYTTNKGQTDWDQVLVSMGVNFRF